jgi:aspartate dehydrogenase
MKRASRICVIGYGAVADEIVRCLETRKNIGALAGVLDTPSRLDELQKKANGRFPVIGTLDELLDLKPDILIEAAGHSAVKQFATQVLARGVDLLIASVGALADDHLAAEIKNKGVASGATIWIAAGAVAGIDGLLAARTLAPRVVKYISVKPPEAWVGTPAEGVVRAQSSKRFVFFEGSAREAAIQYPQNANVAATVAFACLGLDRTRVELVSDPAVDGPLGIIEAEGEFGYFKFDILALASPSNPKTSAITGHSLVSAALDGMRFNPFLDF